MAGECSAWQATVKAATREALVFNAIGELMMPPNVAPTRIGFRT